jgi:hypothetical protein
MKLEQRDCSETSAYKIQTLGNYPEKTYKTPDDGKEICPKYVQLYIKIKLRDIASCWLLLYKYIMCISTLNIKLFVSNVQKIRIVRFLHNWQISSKF